MRLSDDKDITEIARHILGEFQVYFPHGMSIKSTEALACIVYLYLDLVSKQSGTKFKYVWNAFEKAVNEWKDEDQ